MLERLDAAQAAFDKLPAEDRETDRLGRGVAVSLSALAEARAQAEEQRVRLAEMPAETLSSEVERIVKEWKARQNTLKRAAEEVQEQERAYRALVSEYKELEAPRREDVPTGEGLPEIQTARQDAALAVLRIAYYEKNLKLIEATKVLQNELLEAIKETSNKHAGFTRQSARVSGLITHANRLSEEGRLPDWEAPEEMSIQVVWDQWRHFQATELNRLEWAVEIRANLLDAETAEGPQAQLEAQRQILQRAKARLETELGYADFLSRVASQTNDELVARLAPDGEIVQRILAVKAELTELRQKSAVATQQCTEAIQTIQTVENPYSRVVLSERASQWTDIRERLQDLVDGGPMPDGEDKLLPLEKTPQVVLPKELLSDTKKDAIQLATLEGEFVAQEQRFTRIFLNYFVSLETSRDELRASLEERRRLDNEEDTKLDLLIGEEKRRYAAAREIRRRIQEGRLEPSQAPKSFEQWLTRDAVHSVTDELRNARTEGARFDERARYELDRLETLTQGTPWMRLRSEAADRRSALVGMPMTLLTEARKPLEELEEWERRNLDYDARAAEAADSVLFEALIERFTGAEERDRFDETRHTYYLELENRERVLENLTEARMAYEQLAAICAELKEGLINSKAAFQEIVELRLFDYRAVRYAAAVARHPGSRSRIEEAFRETYDRDLRYRLNFRVGDVESTAEQLFAAESRLIAARSIHKDMEILLSKVGLTQEMGWYKSQIARLTAHSAVQGSRANDLEKKISDIRRQYGKLLRRNAFSGCAAVLIIPLIAFLIVRILRRFSRRFEKQIALDIGEAVSDRQRRMQTISATSTRSVAVLVWTITLVYVFAQLGLDVTPIVASASVVGLAAAFGAQALIKDFFSGFFILIENQFTIGDVVTLGTTSGTVERISLRVTTLRDLEGVVHYIPNGSIGQVSNKTQGWSRVVMEISVAYGEDPDRASSVLGEVLLEMAGDEPWREDIIEEPVVAGLENFTERSVDIRIMVKTRPGKQWAVARETRRRIKKRFDELGIEIPFPHRVVHHVYEEGHSSKDADDAPRTKPKSKRPPRK